MIRFISGAVLALACGSASAGGAMQAQQANVAYYTTTFDGGEARFANFDCKPPTFPLISYSTESARRVERSVRRWRSCFARWQERMAAVLPAGKEIPDEVVKAMSTADMAKARETMGTTYRSIIETALAQDEKVNQGIESWLKATGAESARLRARENHLVMRRWREGLPGGPF